MLVNGVCLIDRRSSSSKSSPPSSTAKSSVPCTLSRFEAAWAIVANPEDPNTPLESGGSGKAAGRGDEGGVRLPVVAATWTADTRGGVDWTKDGVCEPWVVETRGGDDGIGEGSALRKERSIMLPKGLMKKVGGVEL